MTGKGERRREEVGKLERRVLLSAGIKEEGRSREIGEKDVIECAKGGGKSWDIGGRKM